VILDEAGVVGWRELAAFPRGGVSAGVKLVCVGDSKHLQPIAASGIFRALVERHGAAETSSIQRQQTDVEPLIKSNGFRVSPPRILRRVPKTQSPRSGGCQLTPSATF
jgi:ATP-dependent exoDNAse (exonuclease V) alpha subunit